jgi:hypothetical protein
MALKLNLYHEVAAQKRAKKRDPLKISLFVLAAITAGFAAYYFVELGNMSGIERELARKKAEFDAVEPAAKAAEKRQAELAEVLKLSELLVNRIENRFYWAPVLEQLVQVVPREVQIVKLSGDLQGADVKKCSLSIDGVSAGPDPRRVAEDLRTAISEEFGKKYKNVSSTFRSLEDGAVTAKLDGRMQPTATFAINIQMTTGEEAAATPAPRERRKR